MADVFWDKHDFRKKFVRGLADMLQAYKLQLVKEQKNFIGELAVKYAPEGDPHPVRALVTKNNLGLCNVQEIKRDKHFSERSNSNHGWPLEEWPRRDRL